MIPQCSSWVSDAVPLLGPFRATLCRREVDVHALWVVAAPAVLAPQARRWVPTRVRTRSQRVCSRSTARTE